MKPSTHRLLNTLPILLLPVLAGCASVMPGKIPVQSPPLATMEEPLPLFEIPQDESARQELPTGGFIGLPTVEAVQSLSLDADPVGLEVLEVVENSPAHAAGIVEGDLLLEAELGDNPPVELQWPSQLSTLEQESSPGTIVRITLDRAGALRTTTLELVPRIAPPPRINTARFREEQRVGIVVRTPTEVEAAAAELAPGAGAVVVGLDLNSPWRRAGLQFGDLIRTVNQQRVDHPQVLLNAIRDAGKSVQLELLRDGRFETLSLPLSRRTRELQRFSIPLLYHFQRDADQTETTALLGLWKTKSTPAAWETRLLWLIRISGGDKDRLEDVPTS